MVRIVSAAWLLFGLAPVAMAADSATPLHEGWKLASACKVSAAGDAISAPGFQTADWLTISVPAADGAPAPGFLSPNNTSSLASMTAATPTPHGLAPASDITGGAFDALFAAYFERLLDSSELLHPRRPTVAAHAKEGAVPVAP